MHRKAIISNKTKSHASRANYPYLKPQVPLKGVPEFNPAGNKADLGSREDKVWSRSVCLELSTCWPNEAAM